MKIIERFYNWKWRNFHQDRINDWLKTNGYDFDREDAIGLFAGEDEHQFYLYWKALRALLKFDLDNAGWGDCLRGFFYHVLCIISMIARRYSKPDSKTYQYETMATWDYRQLYAGWEIYCVDFNPSEMRFYIYKDGDWNM